MKNADEITKESLSKDDKNELDFDTGKKEADVYTEEGLEHLQEDEDEMSPAEVGFMQGEMGHKAKCATCGKVMDETDEVFERDIQGEKFRFCSEECDKKYRS